MTTKSGRNATVRLGTYTIAELASWELDLAAEEIDTSVFGSTWGKSDAGMKKWTLSIEGFCDPTDTNGQQSIEDSYENGSLVNNIKAYVDNTSYWIPDVTTDSNAGGRVTSYRVGQAHNGVASISIVFSGSGPITFV